jgi:sugar phosphate isomerase/epimerase
LWETEADEGNKPHLVRVAKPLREGMVPWPEVVGYLRDAGFDGWISLHREYGVQTVDAVRRDVAGDLAYLRDVLG